MCMYVCMYVCIHCMYVYSTTPQVRIYVCIRVYVCMYICMHTLYVCILSDALSSYLCHEYIHIHSIFVYVYVCIHVYSSLLLGKQIFPDFFLFTTRVYNLFTTRVYNLFTTRVYNAEDTPWEEWPHHSFTFDIQEGEVVTVAGTFIIPIL